MSNFVILEKHTFVLARRDPDGRSTYSIDAAAELAGVHPEMIRYYCRVGLFPPMQHGGDGEPLFDEDSLYELRRIEHYRRHYGVNRRALPLISRLLRDVARLEAEVRFQRNP
jgi:DNA-binding transcriptional MerR regulator